MSEILIPLKNPFYDENYIPGIIQDETEDLENETETRKSNQKEFFFIGLLLIVISYLVLKLQGVI